MRLFLFLAIIAMAGCKPDYHDLLSKKWRPVAISQQLPDSIQRELFAKTTLEFTKEGKYYINGWQKNDTGTYTLTDNGKTLTVSSTITPKVTEISIETLTSEKIRFTTKSDGSSMTAIPVK